MCTACMLLMAVAGAPHLPAVDVPCPPRLMHQHPADERVQPPLADHARGAPGQPRPHHPRRRREHARRGLPRQPSRRRGTLCRVGPGGHRQQAPHRRGQPPQCWQRRRALRAAEGDPGLYRRQRWVQIVYASWCSHIGGVLWRPDVAALRMAVRRREATARHANTRCWICRAAVGRRCAHTCRDDDGGLACDTRTHGGMQAPARDTAGAGSRCRADKRWDAESQAHGSEGTPVGTLRPALDRQPQQRLQAEEVSLESTEGSPQVTATLKQLRRVVVTEMLNYCGVWKQRTARHVRVGHSLCRYMGTWVRTTVGMLLADPV